MKKAAFVANGIVQMFVGVSAALSGALMVLFPDGSLFHMPLSMLNGSPFSDFMIPGLILAVVIGAGTTAAGVMTFKKHALSGYLSVFFGLGLCIWIFVQVSMIGGGHWLQYLYFALGVVEIALGALMVGMSEK